MEVDKENNKIDEAQFHEEFEFKYNFINIPWDDRSTKSKVGIISLLVSIFVATMAIVTHNFYMHYKDTPFAKRETSQGIKCHLVKKDEYKFVARIHSVETQELLCVGAVVSPTSVVANGVCVKAGLVRLHVGSITDPLCKKGFTVDEIEPIVHYGSFSKRLVLLTTYESMSHCGEVIQIGERLDLNAPAYILGRPLRSGRLLSRQPAKLTVATLKDTKGMSPQNTICVTDAGKCPVKAGDLLVQNGRLFGLASTSTHVHEPSTVACFADLRIVVDELKML